ncbi:MAG: hypothetical protein Q8N27_06005 [Candidatus Hydromicrobium sp.]|nr:hypothetical protein [Candidatus Hydromicrobium sp.]
MDFKFLLDINLLTFLLGFVVLGIWQLIKIKVKVDPKLIIGINGAIAVLFAILVVAAKLDTNVFSVMVKAAAVFASGSYFDVLKIYGAIKE